MNILRVRNVHMALPLALQILKTGGVERDSRNGMVRQMLAPVATVYERPWERVLFWSERDANPFFHFYEALWMLAGRNDVESLTRFVKTMAKYSDDGQFFYGAYGYRWRHGMSGEPVNTPKQDQLKIIIDLLRKNPLDRRCVLQMWDSASDLGKDSKDVPCNDTATFQVSVDRRLDLVVFCRSNDIVYGCYGANAVHFSMLLEYVSMMTEIPMGTYTQISVNWHGYHETFDPVYEKMLARARTHDSETENLMPIMEDESPYEHDAMSFPMRAKGISLEEWDRDLQRLVSANGRAPIDGVWREPFFEHVALPILRAHDAYKEGRRFKDAYEHLARCYAKDWQLACYQWLERREKKV